MTSDKIFWYKKDANIKNFLEKIGLIDQAFNIAIVGYGTFLWFIVDVVGRNNRER